MWGSSNLMTQLGSMGHGPAAQQSNLAYYQAMMQQPQQQQSGGWGSALTQAPTPEGYLGRPKRQNPSYFGLNTHANSMADAYNALRGYGIEEYDGGEGGMQQRDNSVRIDPWSGGITSGGSVSMNKKLAQILGRDAEGYKSYNDFVTKDEAFFAKAREMVASLDGLSTKDKAKKLRSKEYQDVLGEFVSKEDQYVGGESSDKLSLSDKIFNTFGGQGYRTLSNSPYATSAIDNYEADYNAKLATFNDSKAAYESAWGQTQEKFMSPVLDQQLRQLMPDDGESFNNAFTTNYDHHINTLNYVLKNRGVEDLTEVASTQRDGKTVFYSRRTGHEIPPDILNYKGGSNDGNVTFKLKALDGGGVTFDTNFKKPSKWAGGAWINTVAPMALGLAMGGIGGIIGKGIGGTMGSVAGGAIGGGLNAAISGGNILKGAVLGGVGGGAAGYVNGAVSGLNLPPALSGAASGAAMGGISSALGGGNFLQGALMGGAGGYVNHAANQFFSPQQKPGLSPYSLSDGDNGLGLRMPNGPATGLRVGDATLNDWSMFGTPFARGDVFASTPLRDAGHFGLNPMNGGTGITSGVLGGNQPFGQPSNPTGEQPSKMAGMSADLIKGLIQIGMQRAFLGNQSGNSGSSNSGQQGHTGIGSGIGSGIGMGGDNSHAIGQYSGIPAHRPLSNIGMSGTPTLIKPLLWEN